MAQGKFGRIVLTTPQSCSLVKDFVNQCPDLLNLDVHDVAMLQGDLGITHGPDAGPCSCHDDGPPF